MEAEVEMNEKYFFGIFAALAVLAFSATARTVAALEEGAMIEAKRMSAGKQITERKGVVTMKGNPVTFVGDEVKVGQRAPDFKVLAPDLAEAKLGDFKGAIKLIASVPSLDTPVCDLEIKRFNEEATRIAKDVAILFISMDLPFAQKRFCHTFDIQNVKTFSDHRDADFGIKYGVLIKEMRLLSRAIFIIDRDDVVRYVEYVKENGSQPNYDAALKALRDING